MAIHLVQIAPNRHLDAAAAASYKRAREDGLPAGGINSDYRTRAEQQHLRNLYLAGKGPQAAPPGYSAHERGEALDLARRQAQWMQAHGEDYGWYRTNNEWWHFEYKADKDLVKKGLGPHRVFPEKLRLRERPSTSSRVVRMLTGGTSVNVTGRKRVGDRTWARVPGGWVAAEYLRRKK